VSTIIACGAVYDDAQEFASPQRVLAKFARHERRHHRDPLLVDAPGRHTLVRRLNDESHASRFKDILDAMGNLCIHLFPQKYGDV